jgi:hypothetical protein
MRLKLWPLPNRTKHLHLIGHCSFSFQSAQHCWLTLITNADAAAAPTEPTTAAATYTRQRIQVPTKPRTTHYETTQIRHTTSSSRSFSYNSRTLLLTVALAADHQHGADIAKPSLDTMLNLRTLLSGEYSNIQPNSSKCIPHL